MLQCRDSRDRARQRKRKVLRKKLNLTIRAVEENRCPQADKKKVRAVERKKIENERDLKKAKVSSPSRFGTASLPPLCVFPGAGQRKTNGTFPKRQRAFAKENNLCFSENNKKNAKKQLNNNLIFR